MMDLNLLVRVYCGMPASVGDETVRIGTAYPVANERILVARHVVAEEGQPIDTAKITLTWFHQPTKNGKRIRAEPHEIDVAWDGGGKSKWDAAILKCTFPDGVSVSPQLLSGRRPDDDERWASHGFADTGLRDDGRKPQPLKGTTFSCADKDKIFQLAVDAAAKLAEGWRGASGAPVFVRGQILGLIIEACPPFEGRRIEAIPMFRLLQIPEFRKAVRLPSLDARTPIDLERFASEISKQFLSAPKVIVRMEHILRDSKVSISKPDALAGLPPERARADALAHMLIDTAFVDALELLRIALESCTTEPEEKERQILFSILCWFLPARYDLEKSEDIRILYEKGDVHLIEAQVATALAAELRMAAIEERDAKFDRDAAGTDRWVGKNCVSAESLPLGLGATKEEEFIKTVEGYLFAKYNSGAGYTGEPELYRKRINNIMERTSRSRQGLPYLLFGRELNKIELSREELESLAQSIRRHYPRLAVLRLSDAREVQENEFDQLYSLRDILQRA